MCKRSNKQRQKLSPVRFELAAFRSGVERATIAPQAQTGMIMFLRYFVIIKYITKGLATTKYIELLSLPYASLVAGYYQPVNTVAYINLPRCPSDTQKHKNL